MEQFHLAEETRPLVRQIASRAGVTGCEVKSSYIKAFREGGLHPLHIGKRATEWFGSRAEAVSVSDLPDSVRNRTQGNGAVNWAVDHPFVRRKSVTGAAPKVRAAVEPEGRDFGVCEKCWQARTPSGSCGCHD